MSEEIPVVSGVRDSPSRGPTGWVKFDEGGGGGGAGSSPDGGSPMRRPGPGGVSPTNSSGISSARGSVNSVPAESGGGGGVRSGSPPDVMGAQLPVSEIQVVDEATLRRTKSSMATSSSASMESSTNAGMSKSNNMSMDNVNLSDPELTTQQPTPGGGGGASSSGRQQQQFQNGDVIVTMLPVNERLPWIMPARFRPELVPEELMSPSLTLTVEEYVQTMEKLTTDMRFTIFNIFYKRILVLWISIAFTILLIVIFAGLPSPQLFGAGVAWLILNAAAIFLCMWIKLKLNKSMEKCMSFLNSSLLKHNIILGVDDRGKLSCQKVNLCFIYFESADCIKKLEKILEEKPKNEGNGDASSLQFDREAYLKQVEEFEDVEVIVPGSAGGRNSSAKIGRKRERAEKLFLHYIQRWSKDYLRRRLDWMMDDMYGRTDYATNTNPRHLRTALCPCQYIEEHLRNKRQRESLNPCKMSSNPCHWCE